MDWSLMKQPDIENPTEAESWDEAFTKQRIRVSQEKRGAEYNVTIARNDAERLEDAEGVSAWERFLHFNARARELMDQHIKGVMARVADDLAEEFDADEFKRQLKALRDDDPSLYLYW
jgi:hypothetical protein